MIPRADIVAWRSHVKWKSDAQVEQDLILSRALVELFSQEFLATNLAFRGGTALHKLHLTPASRYSEDLDFVQIRAGPIGSVSDAIRKALDPFLGKPTWKQKQASFVLVYRMASEIPPIANLRLKIEINTREHFTVIGFEKRPFEVNSRWFSGRCELTTYDLNELLGTKLRALYQRRKGRDLFDLWFALTQGKAKPHRVVEVFKKYMMASGQTITREKLKQNLLLKMNDHDFLHDTDGLLQPGVAYDPQAAYRFVNEGVFILLE
jgi:predicted nucleotidyltransferase component of viral defense system